MEKSGNPPEKARKLGKFGGFRETAESGETRNPALVSRLLEVFPLHRPPSNRFPPASFFAQNRLAGGFPAGNFARRCARFFLDWEFP